MREAIAAIVRGRTRAAWCEQLEGTDACFAPVLTVGEAARHPHALARGTYVEVEGVVQPGPAPRFDRSAPVPVRPAPEVGVHTHEVLSQAGFTMDDIQALQAAGAIAK
jgi:alpha-methylacyl-CoA racemase